MYREWYYHPIAESMWDMGLENLDVYIWRRHNKVAPLIITRPIMYLILEVDRHSGARVEKK